MSWIWGAMSESLSSQETDQFKTIHANPLTLIRSDTMYLAAGGIPETCLHGSFLESRDLKSQGWLIVGIGLRKEDDHTTVFNENDWRSTLNSPDPNLNIDGHFVAVKWQKGKIECYTDQLGIRTLYILKKNDTTIFSTRLDWLAKLNGNNLIDWGAFGASWLTLNQVSYDCLLKDIHRVGPNGRVIIEPKSFSTKHSLWRPDYSAAQTQPWDAALKPYLFPEKERFETTFGLSGGLDSRVLLALYTEQKRSMALHVFGHPGDPDVKIAKQIARKEGLSQTYYHEPVPATEDLLSVLPDYVGQTCLVEPVSSYLRLRYYPQIHSENKILLDGAWGEIIRRQLFIRLGLRGKRAVQTGNAQQIYNYLDSKHAGIFDKDITKQMRQGFEDQITELCREMPKISQIGFENFIDLFAICTHLPNDSGFEQSRVDGQIMSYMPYIQPSFLNVVFQIPVHLKRNGKLSRQLIRENWPSLTKYPLVKAGITYPFYLPKMPAVLWTEMKSKLGAGYQNHLQLEFLAKMSDFIQDTVRSSEVKSFLAYDHRAIISLVDRYYGGKTNLALQLDWFLSFELWRRCMSVTRCD